MTCEMKVKARSIVYYNACHSSGILGKLQFMFSSISCTSRILVSLYVLIFSLGLCWVPTV